ncbi:MAG TPA: hypothetical protein PKE26_12020 [Kiritimatiellia bacterium]|nr:hypothetical protein [Kiritimatiellia bacterium]HMO99828.1 hypothetical protein [Kiritimatiellia bacterium]
MIRLVWLPRLSAILFLALCSACVHVEQDLVLRADGRGSLNVVYGVKDQDVKRMRVMLEQVAALHPGVARADVAWLTSFDEEAIRQEWAQNAGPGVHLTGVRTELDQGWRFARVAVRFDTLQQLLDCGMIPHMQMVLSRGPQGQYGFQQSIDGRAWSRFLPERLDWSNLQPLAGLMMRDFEAIFRVEVPGPIRRSNADRVEGRRAIWELRGDQSDLMARLQYVDLRILFDGRDLKLAEAAMGN